MQNLPPHQVHEHHLRRPSELRITARNCGRDQEEDFEFRIPKVLIIEAMMSTMALCDLQNISGFWSSPRAPQLTARPSFASSISFPSSSFQPFPSSLNQMFFHRAGAFIPGRPVQPVWWSSFWTSFNFSSRWESLTREPATSFGPKARPLFSGWDDTHLKKMMIITMVVNQVTAYTLATLHTPITATFLPVMQPSPRAR